MSGQPDEQGDQCFETAEWPADLCAAHRAEFEAWRAARRARDDRGLRDALVTHLWRWDNFGAEGAADAALDAVTLFLATATPSAPSGDHGGLRLRRYLEAHAVTARAQGRADAEREWLDAIWLLDRALAAHPEPEPAQVGEVGT